MKVISSVFRFPFLTPLPRFVSVGCTSACKFGGHFFRLFAAKGFWFDRKRTSKCKFHFPFGYFVAFQHFVARRMQARRMPVVEAACVFTHLASILLLKKQQFDRQSKFECARTRIYVPGKAIHQKRCSTCVTRTCFKAVQRRFALIYCNKCAFEQHESVLLLMAVADWLTGWWWFVVMMELTLTNGGLVQWW